MLDMLGKIAFILLMTGFLWIPLLATVTLLTPRKLLDKYFKEPHFNKGELITFNSFPTTLMRTSVFCRLYLTPSAEKGRNLYGFVDDSPRWYRISVLVVYLGAITHLILIFVLGGIAYSMPK